MLDLRRLKVLCEVARHGSFSAAAEALGYTQPAVSRQIATLEAETGTVLVRRAPHGAVLTDAGRLLVDRGETILAQLNAIELELDALAGLEGGRLRMASFASAAASIVPVAIAEFRRRYPAVEVSVTMADPIDSLPLLRAGELDIAISHDAMGEPDASEGAVSAAVAGDGGDPEPAPAIATSSPGRGVQIARIAPAVSTAGLELVPLFEDPMYVAMPVGHPLADVEPLSLERFAKEPWMLATSHTCPDSRLFLRACHAAGFEPQIAFQNDDYSAILGFVAAGVGVALVPDMVARGIRNDVVIRNLEPAAPARPIIAVVPSGYRSPSAGAMVEVLAEIGEAWVAERPVLGGRLRAA